MRYKKEELFSEKVYAGSRTYFFDVKESIEGIKYLRITESKKGDKKHKRNQIIIFQEYLDAFVEGFNKVINFIRENRR